MKPQHSKNNLKHIKNSSSPPSDAKMNGVCGSGTATSSIDPRGSITSSVSPINKRAIAGISGSVNVSGCNLPTNQGPDCMRKSRSQGGKKLQKCLSTASYGEEMSLSVSCRSLKATSPCRNLLMTRQYCSFGSTTSHINNSLLSLLDYVVSFIFRPINTSTTSFLSLKLNLRLRTF